METSLFTPRDSYVNRAIQEIIGFEEMLVRVRRQLCLSGKSNVTYTNYARHLAYISLHFKKLPMSLNQNEVEEFLFGLLQRTNFLSASYFKFTGCSLRMVFKIYNISGRQILFPIMKRERKLPVVLSKNEIMRLINQPKLLKHRILIGLMYGCGLRIGEAVRLLLRDIDLERRVVHIRQSKGKKDRYVPLPAKILEELQFYIIHSAIKDELFPVRKNGSVPRNLSREGITFAVKSAAKNAGIIKPVNVHTLRHTYATHLLEEGLDIVSIKELLGHSRIETTMVYLHVAQVNKVNNFSPLDKLEGVAVLAGMQCTLAF